jgi:hypothetical protein
MRRLMCWLLGHDTKTTRARQRVCLRCGKRETLRQLGSVAAWEDVTKPVVRGARA